MSTINNLLNQNNTIILKIQLLLGLWWLTDS